MTQEQKAKRYEEALERANKIYTDKYKPEIAAFCKQSLENIFPELKESEDERIRKAIIESLSKHGYLPQTNIKVKDAVSWLEKQGKKPQGKTALEARTDNELVEEVYSHLDSIKETADRMTSGNFMHNKAAIKFSANTITKVLELIGIKAQKG